jgi:hypothetical protein
MKLPACDNFAVVSRRNNGETLAVNGKNEREFIIDLGLIGNLV